jgi:Nif-specific regulatory protein
MKDNQENFQNLQKENQRLKHIVDELTILNDISNSMSSTMEVQEIMAMIITKAIATIGVEQGTIMLVEKDTDTPLRTIIRGVDDENRGRIYKFGSYLTGWMIKNCKPLLSNDTTNDERLTGLDVEETGIRSILSVPMILQGKLVGVINLFNKKGGVQFTDDDQNLMCIIATQVAAFLSIARSFEIVKQNNIRLQQQTIRLREEVGEKYDFNRILGESQQIKAIRAEIKSVARSTSSVLIIGETGTGKELVAKIIHYNSDRSDKPFVDVNSAALPESLVESEFFGIEEGVATGVKKRIGLFEQANGGTLFIDEISDMSLASQAKILRVLEERKVRRVGSNQNIDVDIRLIAATNKNLKVEIEKGTFREDLYFRLAVFEIMLPPLRERQEDILLLLEHFTQKFAKEKEKTIQGFSPAAIGMLINYEWQGNVRELANVVERAVILTKDPIIGIEYLSSDFKTVLAPTVTTSDSLEDAVNHFKKQVILKTIRECGNNKSEAARKLGISRVYLFKLLKQLEIKSDFQ